MDFDGMDLHVLVRRVVSDLEDFNYSFGVVMNMIQIASIK